MLTLKQADRQEKNRTIEISRSEVEEMLGKGEHPGRVALDQQEQIEHLENQVWQLQDLLFQEQKKNSLLMKVIEDYQKVLLTK